MVELDQRERSFSSPDQHSDDSSPSESSSGRNEESEGDMEEDEGDGCGEGSAA